MRMPCSHPTKVALWVQGWWSNSQPVPAGHAIRVSHLTPAACCTCVQFDLFAGIAVGFTVVPQSLSYAGIAGRKAPLMLGAWHVAFPVIQVHHAARCAAIDEHAVRCLSCPSQQAVLASYCMHTYLV